MVARSYVYCSPVIQLVERTNIGCTEGGTPISGLALP